MAEMTAAKVKMLLESFAAVCGSNSKAKELCGDAVGFIEQQAQEIAKLRLYRGCLDCRFNDSGIINNYLCHGKNCVDFDKWLEKEAEVQE